MDPTLSLRINEFDRIDKWIERNEFEPHRISMLGSHSGNWSRIYLRDRSLIVPLFDEFHERVDGPACRDVLPDSNVIVVAYKKYPEIRDCIKWCDDNLTSTMIGIKLWQNWETKWWFHFKEKHEEALFRLHWQ